MSPPTIQELVEEGTFQFSLGDHAAAIAVLERAITLDPASFAAWHALAEVHFADRRLDAALAAGERAVALRPDDLLINTSLSRIWMERGDKAMAEKFGATAKMLGWKDQLREQPQADFQPRRGPAA